MKKRKIEKLIEQEIKMFEAFRNISPTELIIDKGTKLFHGTIENFDVRNIRPSGYDNVFWTVDNPAIAQTYIPKAGLTLHTSTKFIARPSKDDLTRKIQKALGIEYDYDDVKFKGNQAVSYPIPKLFQQLRKKSDELDKKANNLYTELRIIKNKIADNKVIENEKELIQKYHTLKDKYDKANEISKKYDSEKIINNYINEKLINEWGYTPIGKEEYNKNYQWKLISDNNPLEKADYSAQGRLLILTPQRDLKIIDTTHGGTREGDLTDVDYHRHDWFEQAQERGYDGIKINDFAQSEDQGNFGHTSYGLFKDTLKD